ncbi:MAG: DUF134 domain-containing protein [Thermoproteota archaeon]
MKPRTIGSDLLIAGMPESEFPARRFVPFTPVGAPLRGKDPIVMTPDEAEALRLIDYEGMLQEEASLRMGVSRGTVWRCLDGARKKVGAMIAEGRELVISFGEPGCGGLATVSGTANSDKERSNPT